MIMNELHMYIYWIICVPLSRLHMEIGLTIAQSRVCGSEKGKEDSTLKRNSYKLDVKLTTLILIS